MSYSLEYRERAFQEWYRAGKPSLRSFVATFRSLNGGKGPAKHTYELWKESDEWDKRAGGLDRRALVVAEQRMVEERGEMLSRHKNIAVLLQRKGAEFIQANDLTTEHAALRALETGVHLERQVRGMPDITAAIFNMSDRDLLRFIEEAEDNAIVDAEYTET